jgi:hypothetical protein
MGRTLCSEVGLYVTFLQFGICAHFVIEIHSFTFKKPDSQATAAELCQTSKKQAKQWHFLHSTPQTVVNFQGHTVHISVIERNVPSM